MKTLVSDMGGVLYSFDSSFDPEKHQNEFDKAMLILGKEKLSIKEQLEGEYIVIKSGILKVFPIKTGVKNILSDTKHLKLVIVSTSLVRTSKLILEKIGLGDKEWKIYDMTDYGSKKDENSWRKIFEQLESIDIIVEDTEVNLQAAKKAAIKLSFTPSTYTIIPKLN